MDESVITSGLGLCVLIGALTGVELLIPLHRRSRENLRHLRVNLPLTGVTILAYGALYVGVLAAASATRTAGVGLLQQLDAGVVVEAIATFLGLDLATYLAHRSMHAIPLLWRFHRVHHLDAAVDATTSFRQHPFETLFRAFALAAGAAALGASIEMILIYRTLSAINAVFEHANIRVPLRFDALLSLAFVTPNMHKIHHSRAQAETDSNYGNLLSGFDRLLRTFVPTHRAVDVSYGLEGYDGDEMHRLSGILWLPLADRPGAVGPSRAPGRPA